MTYYPQMFISAPSTIKIIAPLACFAKASL